MDNKHEVKSPLWIKIFGTTVYVGACIAMTFDSDSEFTFLNLWNSKDLVGIAGSLFFFLALPVILLIVLFTKTVFTNSEIIHTNFILQKTRKSYIDIDKVEITKRSDIRLHFVDGTAIKVLTGEHELMKTLKILENHVNIKVIRQNIN